MKTVKWEYIDIPSEEGEIEDDREMWLGHCNFPITKKVVDKLDHVDGIDSLKVVSKHRFVICVGKLYSFHDVRLAVDKFVCNKSVNDIELSRLDNKKVKEDFDRLKEQVSKYKHWAIHIFPNGKLDCCFSNELDNSYLEKYNLLTKARILSNGVLIQNEEDND